MSAGKMPPIKHTVVKGVDPQSTQHHRDVQKVIDTPQAHPMPPAPAGHPVPQGPKNANAMRLEREK